MILTFNDILGRTWQLASGNWQRTGLAVIVLSGLGYLADSGMAQASSFNTLVTGATLAFQYWLTRTLLQELGYPMPDRPRGLAFIGLGILSGLGIILGLLLLVIPGIVLAVRWSIADACLLSSNDGVTDCLKRSWRQTDGQFWPIFTSLLAIYVPAVAFGLGGFMAAQWGDMPDVGIAVSNIATNISIVGGWVAAVAIFSFLNATPELAEIFE